MTHDEALDVLRQIPDLLESIEQLLIRAVRVLESEIIFEPDVKLIPDVPDNVVDIKRD